MRLQAHLGEAPSRPSPMEPGDQHFALNSSEFDVTANSPLALVPENPKNRIRKTLAIPIFIFLALFCRKQTKRRKHSPIAISPWLLWGSI